MTTTLKPIDLKPDHFDPLHPRPSVEESLAVIALALAGIREDVSAIRHEAAMARYNMERAR